MTSVKEFRSALSSAPSFRSFPTKFEVRDKGANLVEVQGYASTTDDPYTMYDMFGEYEELIQAGAFGKTLAEGPDVAFLTNHDGLTMARTTAETLVLSEDTTGLLSVATMNTERGDVRDLVTAIRDGNIDQMSFAFRIMRQQWSPDYMQRTITEVNIDRGDVSAVNYGANPNTSIGMRSFRSLRSAKLARMAGALRDGAAMPDDERATVADFLEQVARKSDVVIDAPAERIVPVVVDPVVAPDVLLANDREREAEHARRREAKERQRI